MNHYTLEPCYTGGESETGGACKTDETWETCRAIITGEVSETGGVSLTGKTSETCGAV